MPPELLTQSSPVQTSCDNPYLYHYCDTTEGDSGSPMWSVSAVTSSASTAGTAAVAAKISSPSPTLPSEPDGYGQGLWAIPSGAMYIRAVHNLEWDDSNGRAVVNSAVAITPLHYSVRH